MAAVSYQVTGGSARRICLYYQAPDLFLKEHCVDFAEDAKWFAGQWGEMKALLVAQRSYPSVFAGEFGPGKVPGHVPLAAVGWDDWRPRLGVFWEGTEHAIRGATINGKTGIWNKSEGIHIQRLGIGLHFAVGQWGTAINVKIYSQAPNNSLRERNLGVFIGADV